MGGGEVGQVGDTGNGQDGVAQVVHVGQSILQPLLLSVSRPREGGSAFRRSRRRRRRRRRQR